MLPAGEELLGVVPALGGVGGAAALLGGAFALGVRHGIDWDHIAAITDITSTAAVAPDRDEEWLVREPGIMLTDESHHRLASVAPGVLAGAAGAATGSMSIAINERPARGGHLISGVRRFLRTHRTPLLLGTLYAVGHGLVVTVLGLIAIVAAAFLPDWIDPVMGRIVGVTLLLLAIYLYASIYLYFRKGGEFRLRSRWMLIFATVRRGYGWLRTRRHGHSHEHSQMGEAEAYGPRAAFGIGMIHGVGAETGTQALIIATAVGASSKAAGVAALAAFVAGLLLSNSAITLATASGFVSTRQRTWAYVAAGLVAATFSVVLGLVFLLGADTVLPDLGPYFRWIGGPD